MRDGGGTGRRRRARISASRLTLTIVLANLIGLVILLLGSFGLTQYRDGLVEAKLEGVRAQAQIIADVLAQVAIDESSCQPVEATDLERVGAEVPLCSLALVQGDVQEVFNRVWDSFEGRVRIYNAPQTFDDPPVKDAAALLIEDVVLREDRVVAETLPPLEKTQTDALWNSAMGEFGRMLSNLFSSGYRTDAAQRSIEDELNNALTSSPFAEDRGAASVRINEEGELVASVSVPIRRVQAIYGVVTAEIGGIDDLVEEARLAILPFFGLASAAAILTSLLLTAAIAQPIRQLAFAADKVREGITVASRTRIPDFSNRRDEIGELSTALRSMTQAIYARMEAIESFAADVAHELKNPLTSIRSATETLAIVKTPEAQEKLMSVIKKDVGRMDRLITDISNASRLDAELARQSREAVDLRKLVADIVDMYAAIAKDSEAKVMLEADASPVYMLGQPSALSQVIRNLIDNACSFSPPDGTVRVRLESAVEHADTLRLIVDDDGPGIPADATEAIFKRFYTKRPKSTDFGANSGLGLAIARQIVESHGGVIWAENRFADPQNGESGSIGARFIVELPAP